MNPDRVRDLLILPASVCILLGWCAALMVALLEQEYTPITVVTPVMLVFGGFLFGSSIIRRAVRGD